MANISTSDAQGLILKTISEFSKKLEYNQYFIPYSGIRGDVEVWADLANDPELAKELFDGLSASGYNYWISRCYTLADMYSLTTRDELNNTTVESQDEIDDN